MMLWFIQLINACFNAYKFILIARILLSWVEPNPINPIVRFIYQITEPILRPFRMLIPIGAMALDLSPLIAFFLLGILQRIVNQLLWSLQ